MAADPSRVRGRPWRWPLARAANWQTQFSTRSPTLSRTFSGRDGGKRWTWT